MNPAEAFREAVGRLNEELHERLLPKKWRYVLVVLEEESWELEVASNSPPYVVEEMVMGVLETINHKRAELRATYDEKVAETRAKKAGP